MAENKTQPTEASVDGFIASIENPRRRSDAQAVLDLYRSVTGFSPVMWCPSIVNFGTRSYSHASGRSGQMPAAAFSPRKANLVFYVDSDLEGIDDLLSDLGKHKRSVSCIYVNKLADVDLDILRAIIERDFSS